MLTELKQQGGSCRRELLAALTVQHIPPELAVRDYRSQLTYENRWLIKRGWVERELPEITTQVRIGRRRFWNTVIQILRKRREIKVSGVGKRAVVVLIPSRLLQQYLTIRGLSHRQAAKELQIDYRDINKHLSGERGIGLKRAERFASYFGNTVEEWITPVRKER